MWKRYTVALGNIKQQQVREQTCLNKPDVRKSVHHHMIQIN